MTALYRAGYTRRVVVLLFAVTVPALLVILLHSPRAYAVDEDKCSYTVGPLPKGCTVSGIHIVEQNGFLLRYLCRACADARPNVDGMQCASSDDVEDWIEGQDPDCEGVSVVGGGGGCVPCPPGD